MAKIIEETVFVIQVTEKELQQIERALYLDNTAGDENTKLYDDVTVFMHDNDVDQLEY